MLSNTVYQIVIKKVMNVGIFLDKIYYIEIPSFGLKIVHKLTQESA